MVKFQIELARMLQRTNGTQYAAKYLRMKGFPLSITRNVLLNGG